MKRHLFILGLFLLGFRLIHGKAVYDEMSVETTPLYKNASLPVEQRVDDLLSRMTLEEKVYQMCCEHFGKGFEVFAGDEEFTMDDVRKRFGAHGVGHLTCPVTERNAQDAVTIANQIQKIAVEEPRLGIPVFINGEALHGCTGFGSTSYPQSIAMSCTWDLPLMGKIGNAIGEEAYSRGVHQVFSPVLDLARDPRHGRIEECYGEDPYLASRMGVEFIKGVQGQNVICSPKHFLANFVADGGRDSGNVGLSERELRELHMLPYEAAVREAGCKSIMAAYNTIDGVPCSANHWLLTDVLRDEWGFDGFVVSDWSAVPHSFGNLKIAPSLGEAAAMCAKAGLDVDLPRLKGFVLLKEMVEKGKITEADIDVNVRRILRAKFELGLFEHPYIDETLAEKRSNAPEYRRLACQAARESIVLLKNEHNILPLSSARKIAVIGPNADVLQLGGYSAHGVNGVTPLQGLKNKFSSQAEIVYAKGCGLTDNDKSGFEEAVEAAKGADVSVLVVGGASWTTGGETRDRNSLELMGVQEDLILEIAKTGKPVVVVVVDGRPVVMTRWIDKVDGVVMMFFAGEEGGNALAEILKGETNPSGKLSVSFPKQTGDVPMCLYHRPYGREGNIVEYGSIPASRYCPLFPFGYGLSYTTYSYKNLCLVDEKLGIKDSLVFSVDVTNTGKVDGDEIVQVYLTDQYCRITQSPKQLKAFQRVHIPAGETRTLSFALPNSCLSFLNEKLEPEVEPGTFELLVGPNCMEGLTQVFEVK